MTTKKQLTKSKKRNPNDSTFRNINALKKRVKKLEEITQDLLRGEFKARYLQATTDYSKRKNKGR